MVTVPTKILFLSLFTAIFFSCSTRVGADSLSNRCAFNQGNCEHQHGFVQDYGYGGVGSIIADAASRVLVSPILSVARDIQQGPPNPECTRNILHEGQAYAGSVWNGTCSDATKEETLALNCRGQEGQGYYQPAIQNIITANDSLDPLQEELVFMDAVSDVHKFTNCQNQLFTDYFSPSSSVVQSEMLTNAYQQFSDLVNHFDLNNQITAEYDMRRRQVQADTFVHCTKEVCPQASPEIFATLRSNLTPQIQEKRQQINALLSRIPMANRDSMRTAMENLIFSNPQATKEQFSAVFNGEMTKLKNEVQRSLATIDEIHVKDPSSGQQWYCVSRELKENLQRSGQIESTVKGLGLEDALAGFTCRSNNRYGVAGMVISELALIPTYFVGYGVARLGLKAGMSTIRAVASAGRTLSTTTRAAMVGVEAADWTAAMAGIERDCHSQTFFSRVEGRECNPADEVGQVYEEASYAQCLTSAILPFASAMVGTTVRLASSRRLDELYQAGAPGRTIVVTGNRNAPPRFLSADQEAKAFDDLEARGVDMDDLDAVVLTTPQSTQLSTHERALIIGEVVDRPLSRNTTETILESLDTGRRGADPSRFSRRHDRVVDALVEEGLTVAQARAKADRLFDSGVLGKVPPPASRPAATPRGERDLVADYGSRQVTTTDENEAFIPLGLRTRAEEGTVYLNSQNSFQKVMNSLGDKELVDAINARHHSMVREAIERELAGRYPGIRLAPYSDYKAIQAAVIVPNGNNARMLRDLRNVLDDVDQQFMREIRAGSFPSIPVSLRDQNWFSTGVGETADLANVQARFPPGTSWTQIESSWRNIRKLRGELETSFGPTPLMRTVTGEVNAKIPTDEVFALLRANSDTTTKDLSELNEIVADVLNHQHGLKLTPSDVQQFRTYADEVDQFSPSLLIARRETHNYDGATHGGFNIDFGGVGSLNAESVAEGLAQGFDLKSSIRRVRENERQVTEYLDLVKDSTRSELSALLERNGVRAEISVSGDDMVVIPDRPLNDILQREIVRTQARVQAEILGRTGRNTNVRVSYFRQGIANPQDRAILGAEGEGIEKLLRKKLLLIFNPAELRTLTIATDMRGSLRGTGDVGLITTSLPPERMTIIQREFRNAIEQANREHGSSFRAAP